MPSLPDSVESAAESDLAALGLLNSVIGQSVLVLARRMDDPQGEESTAALSAAARELRMLMVDLRSRPIALAADPLDQLELKRAKRRAS